MEQREEGKRKKDGSFESSVESGTIERRGRRKNWIMYRQNWKLIKDSIGGGGREGRGEKKKEEENVSLVWWWLFGGRGKNTPTGNVAKMEE